MDASKDAQVTDSFICKRSFRISLFMLTSTLFLCDHGKPTLMWCLRVKFPPQISFDLSFCMMPLLTFHAGWTSDLILPQSVILWKVSSSKLQRYLFAAQDTSRMVLVVNLLDYWPMSLETSAWVKSQFLSLFFFFISLYLSTDIPVWGRLH